MTAVTGGGAARAASPPAAPPGRPSPRRGHVPARPARVPSPDGEQDDSEGARREGDEQLTSYTKGLEAWYKRDKAALFAKYGSLASCERSDKTGLELARSLVTYELCSSTVKNEFGQLLDEATLDTTEVGE